jgi:hypothetical protein
VQEPADKATLEAFLIALSEGKQPRDLHADPQMPTRWQVRLACRKDPDFAELCEDARIIGLEILSEDYLAIADDDSKDTVATERGVKLNTEWVARAALRCKAREFLLERLYRAKYGKTLEINSTNTNYVVELPAPVKDTAEWTQQYGRQNQPAIASLSGALSPDPKPH